MTNPQTEARAIANEINLTLPYSVVQERIAEAIATALSERDATIAAKDAELVEREKERDAAQADALKVGDQMLAQKFRAERAESSLAEREAEMGRMAADKTRLDLLRDESWDLRCFPVPTGGDDADIGWRVVGHWMAEPCERVIAEVYHDDPRAAIDATRTGGQE